MKKRVVYVILIMSLFLGCEKNDEAEPSYLDRDWWVRFDSDDVLDHYIYEVYAEQGIPILYSDTLGQETRYSKGGESYTYYQMLKFGYNLQLWSRPGNYKLAQDRDKILFGAKLFGEKILPHLPEEMRSKAYLLVDTLNIAMGSVYFYNKSAYKDLNFTVVGQVYELDTMSVEAREDFIYDVISVEKGAYLQEIYEDELKDFYDVTDSLKTSNGYKQQLYKATLSYPASLEAPEKYGFLRYILYDSKNRRAYTLDKRTDLEVYIALIMRKTKEEIDEMYVDYPLVLQKSEIMRELLKKLE